MIGGKSSSRSRPTAAGTMLQAGSYGSVIPVIIGTTRTAPIPIWAQNLRQGQCNGKKGKGGKKSAPTYVERIDMLLGHNPIFAQLQWWANGTKYPLNIVKASFTLSGGSVTISDSNFYAVVGVTFSQLFSGWTFSDYGGSSNSPNGTFEVPMFNACQNGPDPDRSSAMLYTPFWYRWRPDFGTTVYVDGLANGGPSVPYQISGTTVNVYYAQLAASIRHKSPSSRVCMTFEPQLGDGNEYDTTWSAQQIIYPEYAGCGSDEIDLGASGTIPSLGVELSASYTAQPTGDAEFADMIESVCKSGQIQAGLALEVNDILTGQAPVQHGLNCHDTPFIVQRKYINVSAGLTSLAVVMDLPVTNGNKILVMYSGYVSGGSSGVSISSSTRGETWTTDANSHLTGQIAYVFAMFHGSPTSSGSDTITVAFGGTSTQTRITIVEIQGLDTIDAATVTTGTSVFQKNFQANFTAANAPKQPELLISMGYAFGQIDSGDPVNWQDLAVVGPSIAPMSPPGTAFDNYDLNAVIMRTVYWPGTFPAKFFPVNMGAGNPWAIVTIGFRNSQPIAYPQPLGNILDAASLLQCRLAARVGGLFGSINMNIQRKAADWLSDFYWSMNAWPVWAGFELMSIPRNEVSGVANGSVYQSWTSNGPLIDLSDFNGDFIGDTGQPAITVERKPQSDAYNILQIQHYNRGSDYNEVITSQPEPASIALYGVRKKSPEVHAEIQDVTIARKLLNIAIRRETMLRNTYKFMANQKWLGLLPGDLITITDVLAGISLLPVRIQTVEEDETTGNLAMTAEPFIYGLHSPDPLTASSPNSTGPAVGADVAAINTPIIFEPVPPLYNTANQRQLWLVVSDSDVNYGGSFVYLSTDGGSTYNLISTINGNGVTGHSTADWPVATSPDTAHDLPVDLTESLGTLENFAVSDEDNYVLPCYIAGGTTAIPYELMTYAVAVLTAANKYTLKATGTGNHLDRAVYGAPNSGGVGVDHPNNSRFATLPLSGQGIAKLVMQPQWIGVTLHFKFIPFNTYGNTQQTLADATDYTYTPVGTAGAVNPGGIPSQLFQVNGH